MGCGGELGLESGFFVSSGISTATTAAAEAEFGDEILSVGIGGSGDVDFFGVSLLAGDIFLVDGVDNLGFLPAPVGLLEDVPGVGVDDRWLPFEPLLLVVVVVVADGCVVVGVGVVDDRFLPFLPTGFFFSFLAGSDRRGPSSLWPTSSLQPTKNEVNFQQCSKTCH